MALALRHCAVLLAGLLLAGCSRPRQEVPDPAEGEPAPVPAPAATAMVAPGAAIDYPLEVEARIRSESEVAVVARADGIVSEVVVERGARVAAGALLARLERRERELELRASEAELARARGVEARRRLLRDQGLVSSLAYEEAQHDLEVAQAARDLAAHLLERTDVRAPIAGVIVERRARPGQFVRESDAEVLFRVAGEGPREARVYLPEWSRGYLRRGMPVSIAPLFGGGIGAGGRVEWISPELDPVAGTLEVRVALPAGGDVPTGASVRLRFDLRSDPASPTVPREALAEPDPAPGGEGTVEVEGSAGSREPRRVRLGLLDGSRVEVRSGLAAGERVRLSRPR